MCADVDHMKTKLIKEACAKETIAAHYKKENADLPSLPTGNDIRTVATPSVFLLAGSHAIAKGSITNEESVEQFSTCSNAALWWAKTVQFVVTKHEGKEANLEGLNKTRFSPDPTKKHTSPHDKIEIQDSKEDQDSKRMLRHTFAPQLVRDI